MMQRIIKKGKWKYSDNYYEKITIVEQDWDEFYEEGYSNFLPNLNDEGLVYFIHYGEYWYNEYGSVSSRSISTPFLSINEAIDYVNKRFKDLIWD